MWHPDNSKSTDGRVHMLVFRNHVSPLHTWSRTFPSGNMVPSTGRNLVSCDGGVIDWFVQWCRGVRVACEREKMVQMFKCTRFWVCVQLLWITWLQFSCSIWQQHLQTVSQMCNYTEVKINWAWSLNARSMNLSYNSLVLPETVKSTDTAHGFWTHLRYKSMYLILNQFNTRNPTVS